MLMLSWALALFGSNFLFTDKMPSLENLTSLFFSVAPKNSNGIYLLKILLFKRQSVTNLL